MRELIEQYGQDVAFFAPELASAEAARHLPTINIKRGVDPGPLLYSLDPLRVVVDEVPPELTDPLERAAVARIGVCDPMD